MGNCNPQQDRITVASAQIDGVYGDIAANLEAHLGYMEQARARGVDRRAGKRVAWRVARPACETAGGRSELTLSTR